MKNKLTSLAILFSSIFLAYVPLPVSKTKISLAVGTELVEPLKEIVASFQQENPHIEVTIDSGGSQDLIDNFLDKKITPTIIIPANKIILDELEKRYLAQYQSSPFAKDPQALTQTVIVAVSWQERAKILFPEGKFSWKRLEDAIKAKSWQKIGGKVDWGSFDLVLTDPTRSNSSQLALLLWAESATGKRGLAAVSDPKWQDISDSIEKAVYEPARSTDILLQEFIARGANDGDIGLVYESIALYRQSKDKPYQILYPNPTIITTAEAAIVSTDNKTIEAAQKFIDYAKDREEIFQKFGFRSLNKSDSKLQVIDSPDIDVLTEIQKTWQK